MVYSLKIIHSNPDSVRHSKYNIQVEEISEGGVRSLAELDDKLVERINMRLSEKPLEIDNKLFDPVDESILFDLKDNHCPLCNK